jgi:(2Fe-2S) ferredoxin
MAEFKAQILVCTNSKGAADKRHCGDKGGLEVLQAFREARTRLGLEKEVAVNKTGCTSQHSVVSSSETTVIIYGPSPQLGGVWYKVSAADVEEICREHIQNGRVVERLRNPAMCVKFKS